MAATGLLGRDDEWQHIRGLIRSTAAGFGQSLVVEGGAGTGKTAILQHAAAAARADGYRVHLARGSYAGRKLGLGLAGRLLHSARSAPTDEERDGLPELAWPHPDDPAVPTLLVVDDLQWADQESLEWLATLPERVASLRVGLLIGVCCGVPPTDPAIIEEIQLSSQRITLRPLSEDVIVRWLEQRYGRAPDPRLVTTVMRATGGNPLLVSLLADRLAETDENVDPVFEGDPATLFSDSLARVLEARLRRVSPIALTLLRGVAALDEETTLHRLSVMAGVSEPETVGVVAHLRQLGLLVVDQHRRPRVHLPMVRSAAMAEDRLSEVRQIHSRAARLLRDEVGAEQSVLRHLLLSAPIGDGWARETLRSAARTALTNGDPESSALYLRRALAEPLDPGTRADVLLALATAAGRTDLPRAARYLAEWMSSVSVEDAVAGVSDDLFNVIVLGAGRHDVDALIAASPGRVGQLGSDRLPRSSRYDGPEFQHLRPSAPDASLTIAVQAMREAERGTNRPLATMLATRALQMSVAAPDDLTGRMLAARVLQLCGQVDEAAAQYQDVLHIARRWGHHFWAGAALMNRAQALYALGDLRMAESAAREAGRTLVECRAAPGSAAMLALQATHVDILVDLGRTQEAMILVERFQPLENLPPSRWSMSLLVARGRLRTRIGQPLGGLTDLVRSGDWLLRKGISNPSVLGWRCEASRALLAAGDLSRAKEYAEAELDSARAWGAPAAVGGALRALAKVSTKQRSFDHLQESVRLLRVSGQRLSLAESLIDLGGLLVEQGARSSARELLREARTLAERAASPDLIRRSREQIAASGGRPRAAVDAGTAVLTRSELRVAELAAAHKTNKAIATLLFVGQRTVEIHLTNVYRKLGIEGRTQLPEALSTSGAEGAR